MIWYLIKNKNPDKIIGNWGFKKVGYTIPKHETGTAKFHSRSRKKLEWDFKKNYNCAFY